MEGPDQYTETPHDFFYLVEITPVANLTVYEILELSAVIARAFIREEPVTSLTLEQARQPASVDVSFVYGDNTLFQSFVSFAAPTLGESIQLPPTVFAVYPVLGENCYENNRVFYRFLLDSVKSSAAQQIIVYQNVQP
jgi:hypothetical protein